VDLNRRGAWEITVPVQLDPISCQSLYEARRAAYRFAAHWHPCEVVICDAYHRVTHRQVIDSYEDAAAYSDHYSQADRGLCFYSETLSGGWNRKQNTPDAATVCPTSRATRETTTER
jgi:hypothetical protein